MKKNLGSWIVMSMAVVGPGIAVSVGCGGNVGNEPAGVAEPIDLEDEHAGEAEAADAALEEDM
ncbi:MAG TPA: hypothetical protein VMM76_04195 [Pirellulaceae bacterium]|nr:hypothetical protein [Pirellulaceae bacterium]